MALLTEPAYRLANKTSNSTWGHIGAALRPPHVGASLLTRHTTPSLPLVASFLELVFEARRPPASPLVAVMVPGSGPSQRPTAVPSPLGLWCKNCFAVHRAATMPMFLEVFHGKRWQEWIISRMIWPWKLQVMTISTNPSMVLAPPRMPGRHCTVRGRWPFLMQKNDGFQFGGIGFCGVLSPKLCWSPRHFSGAGLRECLWRPGRRGLRDALASSWTLKGLQKIKAEGSTIFYNHLVPMLDLCPSILGGSPIPDPSS